MGSAFHRDLATFEVTLRNSIDRCLVDAYGRDWLTNGRPRLDHGANARVDSVLATLRHLGKPARPTNIIAALPFGFWVRPLRCGRFDLEPWPKDGLRDNHLEEGCPQRVSVSETLGEESGIRSGVAAPRVAKPGGVLRTGLPLGLGSETPTHPRGDGLDVPRDAYVDQSEDASSAPVSGTSGCCRAALSPSILFDRLLINELRRRQAAQL